MSPLPVVVIIAARPGGPAPRCNAAKPPNVAAGWSKPAARRRRSQGPSGFLAARAKHPECLSYPGWPTCTTPRPSPNVGRRPATVNAVRAASNTSIAIKYSFRCSTGNDVTQGAPTTRSLRLLRLSLIYYSTTTADLRLLSLTTTKINNARLM